MINLSEKHQKEQNKTRQCFEIKVIVSLAQKDFFLNLFIIQKKHET